MGGGLWSSQPGSPFSHDMLRNSHLKLEGEELALGAAGGVGQVGKGEKMKYRSLCIPPNTEICMIQTLNLLNCKF